ncbi:MAG: DUF4915 domain-containing protein [Bacteroidales bacterium]|nr:DUF4915 domain-containing protein [Bacteroidales bacterium]
MDRKSLHKYYNELFRNPLEIAANPIQDVTALNKSLKFKADSGFVEILRKLDIQLFVTREYEHLLLCLETVDGKINQSFYPIAHPSGIAIHADHLYLASTRNPNAIVEFTKVSDFQQRVESKSKNFSFMPYLPSRIKYFPGQTYFHDLVFIDNQLFANSVGNNGVIKINFDTSIPDPIVWKPNLPEKHQSKLLSGNYLQLNSIATGKSLENSYFSASVEFPGKYRPGHQKFQVDKKGVIFSSNGEIVCRNLTRPHSARMFKDKIWVNDSGYGTVGYVEDGKYFPVIKLNGWTRGLHFVYKYAFVGTSRVLPKFEHYAPGVDHKKSETGIVIINTETLQIEGKIIFPNGNQIFGIESFRNNLPNRLFMPKETTNIKHLNSIFYQYKNT